MSTNERHTTVRRPGAVALAVLAIAAGVVIAARTGSADAVLPALRAHLVAHYDFDHPAADPASEADQGPSGTMIRLVNGGAAMRVADNAYAGSGHALQTRQVNASLQGNDDWKAGVYDGDGVVSLGRFGRAAGITLMGWVKPTGSNPGADSTTTAAGDSYNSIGLFGLLSGASDGHAVRALVELITVSGTMRLVALGRRIDAGDSHVLAAAADWRTLLPDDTWTHLSATFDFDAGTMALYRNGLPLAASYTAGGDRWAVAGGVEPDVTSAAPPAGIKIGGSYPQNSQEKNAFTGRFDDLMFFDRALTAPEISAQFARFRP